MGPIQFGSNINRRLFLECASLGAIGLGLASQGQAETTPSREASGQSSHEAAPTTVKTILSFATEVAHAEEDFDFIKAIAQFLTAEKLVGNFHLTGDYARALKRHGRMDVVQALACHEIGFHCNHHGAKPFMLGYLEQCAWDEGVSRWLANESPGFAIVAELFGRRPTYYTTEFAKAPQAIYGSALMGAGIIGYLPVPMRQHSAVWFCNSLVPSVEHIVALESFHASGDREQAARTRLDQSLAKQKAAGKDVLRIFLHSYKYYAADPYDRLTMTKEIYKNDNHDYEDFPTDFPRRPSEQFHDSFEKFKRTIRHHARNSQFVTFSQYRAEFQDSAGVWIGLEEVDRLCRSLEQSLDAYSTDSVSISPAEAFGIVVRVLRVQHEKGDFPAQAFVRNLIGPRAPVSDALPDRTVKTGELWRILAKVDRELDTTMAVPARLMIAGAPVGPGQLLRGLVRTYLAMRAARPADQVAFSGGNLPEIANEPYFQETVSTRKGLYPDDFTGTKICEMCRVQSWTWKPALKSKAAAGKKP